MSEPATARTPRAPIPASAGIGLRAVHERALLESRPGLGFLEVHSENYFAPGNRAHATLARLRQDYALSLHGVGLSLGSVDALDRRHLARLADLIARYEPAFVSEHLSWSSVGGRFVNDLLPLPFTREALEHCVLRVDEAQERLRVRLLVENVSSYLRFRSDMPEHCFLAELAQRTGCGVLLDVNNLYVNERNHGVSAAAIIDALPADVVVEMHLAGHSVHDYDGEEVVVDTHDSLVAAPVWTLYAHAVERFGRVPTLIEWDARLPKLEVLIGEARHADAIQEGRCELAA